jgi:hypothetical protein
MSPALMPERKTIKIDYIKSSQFRVVHADGVFGGITPRGNIHLDIWSERPPIPQQVVHEIAENALGDESVGERRIRDADMIREVEIGIVMDLSLAKATVGWLQAKIDILEAALAASPSND